MPNLELILTPKVSFVLFLIFEFPSPGPWTSSTHRVLRCRRNLVDPFCTTSSSSRLVRLPVSVETIFNYFLTPLSLADMSLSVSVKTVDLHSPRPVGIKYFAVVAPFVLYCILYVIYYTWLTYLLAAYRFTATRVGGRRYIHSGCKRRRYSFPS